jgi:hypothetical protein
LSVRTGAAGVEKIPTGLLSAASQGEEKEIPMLNRWSVLVLALGVVIGYSFSGRPVNAQSSQLPFSTGNRITLVYENDSRALCIVGEIRGRYIKCTPRDTFATQDTETWRTLDAVVQVLKHRE